MLARLQAIATRHATRPHGTTEERIMDAITEALDSTMEREFVHALREMDNDREGWMRRCLQLEESLRGKAG